MTRAAALASTVLLGAAACGGYEPPRPGFVLRASSASTAEGGGTATIEVSLAMSPRAPVEVDVASSDATEGALVGPGGGAPVGWLTLVFTPSDWNVPRQVTAVGLDDEASDGDVTWSAVFAVGATEDPAYAALDAVSVRFSNRDDDTPAILLSKTSLATWELGRTTDAFTAVLAARPGTTVTVPVVSPRPEEALLRADSSSALASPQVSLVFTPTSWNTPQSVTVVARHDGVEDGDQTFAVRIGPVTGDARYAALPAREVSVTVQDVDGVGRFTLTAQPQWLWEGQRGTLCVRYATAAPSEDVFLSIASGDSSELLVSTVSSSGPYSPGATLVVRAGTTEGCAWFEAPLDLERDGTRSSEVTVGPSSSADRAFDGQPPQRVQMHTQDVDQAGLVVLPARLLATSEAGLTDAFSVALAARPYAEVTVPVVVRDPSEVLVSAEGAAAAPELSLTFTPVDWSVARVVTVHGLDDAIAEPGSPHWFGIQVGPPASLDPAYASLGWSGVYGWNADDDPAVDEGSAAAPLDVTGAVPRQGSVGVGTSHYSCSGLPAGALVTLTSATSSLPVTVDDDGDTGNGFLCAFTAPAGGRGACLAHGPAAGSVIVRVDGSGTTNGAVFDLDVSPYHVSGDVPRAIPDVSAAGMTSSLTVGGAPASVTNVTVVLRVTHTYAYDLEATLISPLGSRVQLFGNTWASISAGGYPFTVFDDAAKTWIFSASTVDGTFRPVGFLGQMAGQDGNGTWRLELIDRINLGRSGLLDAWGVSIR